jgi:redox-sensitive bicupin YhaK (pirin superfamily)
VSDLDTRPAEQVCASAGAGLDRLLITARRVPLGKTAEVARALPDRQVRMIGAWCFLDHYGPEDLGDSPGMRVWAHPHTGLQTVSWLFEGEIEHRDSLGSQVMVRPGQLNLMTAGHGIVHSELSPPDRPPRMHGVQLWVALPDRDRDIEPRFESYPDLPGLEWSGVRGRLLVGQLAGAESPARTHTPMFGADLTLAADAELDLEVEPGFEHGVLAVAGSVTAEDVNLAVDQLVYLAPGRNRIRLSSAIGGRLMLLGGAPFAEEIVMWWNFIGRSHDEIVTYRAAWEHREPRFPPVVDRTERVMEAPPMPTIALKPRPSQRIQP